LALIFVGGSLAQAAAQLSDQVGDWPQWRERHRDGLARETGLLKTWPESGPRLRWSTREVGIGYGGPALVGSRLYLLGDLPEGCHVMALERASGQQIWKTRVGPPGGNSSYPGPRATPSIDGNLLITMTQHGEVVCLDLPEGRLRWQRNLERDLGGIRPMWHFGESPLVDGDQVICTPGGPQGTLAALDKRTGAVLWRSRGITNPPAYPSVILAECAGVGQYVQLTAQNVFGVDTQSGAPLWNVPRQGVRAIVPTPVSAGACLYLRDQEVLLCCDIKAGN
jgi:outer membrane protein assembly factor BamB